MDSWLQVLIYVVAIAACFGASCWYIEVYTARKHMREAIRETDEAVRTYPDHRRGPSGPRPGAWPEPMKGASILYLGDLQRLKLEPGDVFVLSIESRLTKEQQEAIRAEWKKTMNEAKLLVLSGGMKLGAVHRCEV